MYLNDCSVSPSLLVLSQGLALAGLGSGLTEGVMITPFERVKVSLQAQRNKVRPGSHVVMMFTSNGMLIQQAIDSNETIKPANLQWSNLTQ